MDNIKNALIYLSVAFADDELAMEHVRELFGRIEDEIDEKYVKLPMDKNGEPWHLHDKIDVEGVTYYKVVGIGSDVLFYCGDDQKLNWCTAGVNVHHKELTLQGVLKEFAKRVLNSGHQWGLDSEKTIAEFVGKIERLQNKE